MFKTRLISGIILIAVALLLIIPGGPVLLVGCIAISLIGMMEFYRVIGVHKTSLAVVGYLAAIIYYGVLYFWNQGEGILLLTVAFLLVLLIFYVLTYPKYRTEQILVAFFGVYYVAVLISFIYRVRELDFTVPGTGEVMPIGKYVVWLIFLCSWGSDTCAYCVGMLFGKHKMTPLLSPKKSWEGAVGGVVGAAALTAIYTFLLKKPMGLTGREILILALIAAAAAVISMFGDLAASAVKRNYEIKDYGKLIPGHGGILDRFDSVIITAPVIYYLATILL